MPPELPDHPMRDAAGVDQTDDLVVEVGQEHLSLDELVAHVEAVVVEQDLPLAPGVAGGFAAAVHRRVGMAVEREHLDDVVTALVDAVLVVDERTEGTVTVRVRPVGSLLLDGSPSLGSVVEVVSADRQFIVTSVSSELYRLGLRAARVLHPVLGCRRSPDGRLLEVGPARESENRESFVQIELDGVVGDSRLDLVRRAVLEVMADVVFATGDDAAIHERVLAIADRLEEHPDERFEQDDCVETAALLRWLLDDHFVLLGCCTFVLGGSGAEEPAPVWVEQGLGLLTLAGGPLRQPVPQPATAPLLDVARTAEMSRVHRRVPLHRIDVALGPDAPGDPATVFRLVGVVTRRADAEAAADIPVLRRKLDAVLRLDDVVPGSYDEQTLVSLFQLLPRDELFEADVDSLRATLNLLLAAEHEDPVQVQLRPDPASRTVSVLLVLPHDRYTRALRQRIEQHLLSQLDGHEVDVEVSLGNRAEAVVRFLVHVRDGAPVPSGPLDDVAHEVRQLCRTWEDRVREELRLRSDPRRAGQLMRLLVQRLPSSYRSATDPLVAAADVEALRRVEVGEVAVDVRFDGTPVQPEGALCRVCASGERVELSDFLPILESLGLWVIGAVGWTLEGGGLHVHEFELRLDRRLAPRQLIDPATAGRLARGVAALATGEADVDSLNRLVVTGGLDVADVSLVRAYRRYRRQVIARYSVERVNDVLVDNPDAVRALLEWFRIRFDPDAEEIAEPVARAAAFAACDRVTSLDDDRILRGLAGTFDATLRTNRYLRPEGPIALKFDSAAVPDMTAPVPYREVFVAGTQTEGIHVRFGPVARGGIRFSDRPDDYRSEVIDLARTQVLKNALITPTGAKGGFIVHRPKAGVARGPLVDARTAYESFITGLLDITDNRVGDDVVASCRRRDGDDPYLVVAADKGTAAFSDVANGLAEERGFWLGDAFASGGSDGYDHKALGVTARGAWVAARSHFAELGIDPQAESISVVGIGDLSGDVFGNGMVRSPLLKVVAAFDHRHVFLDPDPDPAVAYAERRRVAALRTSSWDDYHRGAISEGGGVWSREDKSIPLSDRVRQLLRSDAEALSPPELIQAILRAPVDLLFAGGVGTFIRASTEPDELIDDRANSEIRVDASTVRARVVCEGANLALTQRARVELARRGGRVNLDAIDNSAGVDTSDHEVNLKVLLAPAVASGQLSKEARDELLGAASDDVVAAVLAGTALQCEALRRAQVHSEAAPDAYAALLDALATDGVLDRRGDALPSTDEVAARKRAGAGLTRPELALLLAGAKQLLRADLRGSDLLDRPALRIAIESYVPAALLAAAPGLVDAHPLRREITSMVVVNDLIDQLGPTCVHRLAASSGAPAATVATALWAARRVLGAPLRWRFDDRDGDASPTQVPGHVDGETWMSVAPPLPPVAAALVDVELVESLARSYLDEGIGTDPGPVIARDRSVLAELEQALVEDQGPIPLGRRTRAERLSDEGVPSDEAVRLALREDLDVVPAVAVLSARLGREPREVLRAFRRATDVLDLDGLERQLDLAPLNGPWAEAIRGGVFDDMVGLRATVVERALGEAPETDVVTAVDRWLADRARPLEGLARLRHEAVDGQPPRLEGVAVVVRALRRALDR